KFNHTIIAVFIAIAFSVASCNNSTKTNEQKSEAVQTTTTTRSMEAKVWQCPMDPHVIKNDAGKCPVCGMDLEQKTYHEALMFLSNFKKENAD
ncbi:heavy metal-binding domain-containing protein, partial [Klebsiella pneumoniae]|uniref:heavy metal-binding domain-containing protein n=1 Tax=Klebsiella pneumoniae TaxID=573 RepID=UPI003854B6FA